MFFEAVEKKLEVTVKNHNLYELEDSFWESLVSKARAQILSSVKSSQCKAYLLSESTLLVWPHKFTLVTCGQTPLISAGLWFLSQIEASNITNLIFERKNEKDPALQDSCFFQDIQEFEKIFQGEAYCFQSSQGPKLYLYETKQPLEISDKDKTLEVLNHDLALPVREILMKAKTKEEIRNFLKVDDIFKGYTIDDHLFSPFGYSLNAVCEDSYYMFHMSPQQESSYVSFETNDIKMQVIPHLIETLKPQVSEVMLFSSHSKLDVEAIEGYFQSQVLEKKLISNYKFDYLQISDKPNNNVFYETKGVEK